MTIVYRFTAEWCKPCGALKKVLEKENIEIKNIIDVDLPENKPLMAKYNIRSIPAIIIDHENGDFDRLGGESLGTLQKELLRESLARENKS